MVVVEATPYKNFSLDFIEGETVGQIVQRIIDTEKLEIRGSWTFQDTSQAGRLCASDEIIVDGRLYHWNVMIAS